MNDLSGQKSSAKIRSRRNALRIDFSMGAKIIETSNETQKDFSGQNWSTKFDRAENAHRMEFSMGMMIFEISVQKSSTKIRWRGRCGKNGLQYEDENH